MRLKVLLLLATLVAIILLVFLVLSRSGPCPDRIAYGKHLFRGTCVVFSSPCSMPLWYVEDRAWYIEEGSSCAHLVKERRALSQLYSCVDGGGQIPCKGVDANEAVSACNHLDPVLKRRLLVHLALKSCIQLRELAGHNAFAETRS